MKLDSVMNSFNIPGATRKITEIITDIPVNVQIVKTAADITVIQSPCSSTEDDLGKLKVFRGASFVQVLYMLFAIFSE